MKKSSDTVYGIPAGLEAFSEMLRPGMGLMDNFISPMFSTQIAMLNWQARGFKMLAAASRDWLEFLGRRLDEDAAFAEKLRATKDPRALMTAYSDWVQKAARDYQREFMGMARFANGLSDAASDALQDVSIPPQVGAVSAD